MLHLTNPYVMKILLVKKNNQDIATATFATISINLHSLHTATATSILQPTCLVDTLRSMLIIKKEKLATKHYVYVT